MRKNERLALLLDLLDAVEVDSQEEIVALLKERGYTFTQATISRDVRELGLIKVPTSPGVFRYTLPSEVHGNRKSILGKALRIIDIQGNFVKLEVTPGTATSIKNQMRTRFPGKIFSIISDDDSVLFITRTEADAKEIYEELKF